MLLVIWLVHGKVFLNYLSLKLKQTDSSLKTPIKPSLIQIYKNSFSLGIFRYFADDTIIYSCSLNYKEAAHKLSNDTHIVLK